MLYNHGRSREKERKGNERGDCCPKFTCDSCESYWNVSTLCRTVHSLHVHCLVLVQSTDWIIFDTYKKCDVMSDEYMCIGIGHIYFVFSSSVVLVLSQNISNSPCLATFHLYGYADFLCSTFASSSSILLE